MVFPLVFIFLAAFSSTALGLLSTGRLNQQCWHEQFLSTADISCSISGESEIISRISPTSSVSRPFVPRYPGNSEHAPWSFPPTCTDHIASIGDKLCVYTNASFSNGRGISIFTTPQVAKDFAALPPFHSPSALNGINDATRDLPYYTKGIPGRGVAMLATRKIKRGDLITAHTPAFLALLEQDLSTREREKHWRLAIDQLPESLRKQYLSLAKIYGFAGIEAQDVMKANNFEMNIGGQKHVVVVPEPSRINHACAPNAQYYHDDELLSHVVHATRDIQKDEEITIAYSSPLDTTSIRQQHLRDHFFFTCTCSRCTNPDSDNTLEKIRILQQNLNDWSPTSTASTEKAERLLRLYEQEGLEGFMESAYGFAALTWNAVGDRGRAVEYAKRAIEVLEWKEGPREERIRVWKELVRDPKGHWSWRRRVG